MAVHVLTYRLKSSRPLLVHNGQLADPLNVFSKAIKDIASKRKKTEADLEEIARLEFLGGLYMSDDGPIIPDFVLSATIINGAKKFREGDLAKTGLFVDDHAALEYDGPRTPDEMWKCGKFRDTRAVSVSRAKVMRTRPLFDQWEATVRVEVDDEVVNPNRVDEWMRAAGRRVGFCELRPTMGRFTVERMAA